MKKHIFLLAAVAVLATMIQSCSSGGSSTDTKLFGPLPGVYQDYLTKMEALKNESVENRDDFEKVHAEAEKIKEDYKVKIEDASKALDGRALDVANDSCFTVKTPLSLTFDGFFSRLDMLPKFKVSGEVVTAKDIFPPMSDNLTRAYINDPSMLKAPYHVNLVCYDAEGNELFTSKIGYIKAQVMGDRVGIPASTPVDLESLQFSKKKCPDYERVATMKIAVYFPD